MWYHIQYEWATLATYEFAEPWVSSSANPLGITQGHLSHRTGVHMLDLFAQQDGWRNAIFEASSGYLAPFVESLLDGQLDASAFEKFCEVLVRIGFGIEVDGYTSMRVASALFVLL